MLLHFSSVSHTTILQILQHSKLSEVARIAGTEIIVNLLFVAVTLSPSKPQLDLDALDDDVVSVSNFLSGNVAGKVVVDMLPTTAICLQK